MKINLEDALASLADARHEDIDEAVANALFKVAVAYLERRRVDEAAEALDEAEHLCRMLDNREGLIQVDIRASEVDLERGDAAKAVERLERVRDHFRAKEDEAGRMVSCERLAHALLGDKRAQEAAACLEEALSLAAAGEDQVAELLFTQQLAPVYRALGRWEDARGVYARMGALADGMGDGQRVAVALVGMGACLAQTGDLDQALTAMGQARNEFEELGQMERARMVQEEIDQLGPS